MSNTPKKYKNALSYRRVSSLAKFVEWVVQINKGNMLFRGMTNAEWDVESSLYRRLKFNEIADAYINNDMFLERTQMLIIRASEEGYNIKNGQVLNNLELLVDLQHHGAATCLIDFTKNSFVALCFSCESVDNKNGIVFAIDRENTKLYNEIKENTGKDIGHWLREYEREQKPWILSPKRLNNRIASQQSVFVFGSPTLSNEKFHVCEIKNKKRIMEELKKNGISTGMLFDDLVGFATQNSHNKKYDNVVAYTNNDLVSAINYYDKVIRSNPKDAPAYNDRGIAKSKLGNFPDAISDFDNAIDLHPDYKSYYNRGLTKGQLGEFQGAITDFGVAIELNPKSSFAYYNRGIAKFKSGDKKGAAADCTKAKELDPELEIPDFSSDDSDK